MMPPAQSSAPSFALPNAKPFSRFGKAMADLHIEHIKAAAPQAKELGGATLGDLAGSSSHRIGLSSFCLSNGMRACAEK
jgi:hypothetical protein